MQRQGYLGGQKSAIDYALANQKMMDKYVGMSIDEEREIFDLSDHCMLRVELTLKAEQVRQKQNNVVVNCMTEERKTKFVKAVREELEKVQDMSMNMERFDSAMKEAAKAHIRKTNKGSKYQKEKGRYETIWMTEKVKKEIKLRKRYNRLKRGNLDPDIEEMFKKKYQEQKQKVKNMVREEVQKHERKITEEIKRDKNGKLWEKLNYLRGKNKTRKIETQIFDENGTKIEENKLKEDMTLFWEGIYRKTGNNIEEAWTQTKEQYSLELENQNVQINGYRFPVGIQEHMDYAIEIRPEERHINPMDVPKITPEQLEIQIRKMKNKKAPGNNKLTSELYKEVAKNDVCLQKLTTAMNNTIARKEIPEEWTKSTTKLIPKTKNPKIKDFRPIALTECSYKICMGLIKGKIEEHLERNGLNNEMQFGFTKKRRTTDSIYILKYIIERSYKDKKMLIITSVDFQKAFDSVDRNRLLEAMKKYKIHPQVIDVIVEIYRNDKTTLKIDEAIIDEVDITSGIRQGCNGSTVLFLLVTYIIIEEITKLKIGIKLQDINITTLFFADDGLLLTNKPEDAAIIINKLEKVGSLCGLNINKDKSQHIINKNCNNIDKINDIKVVSCFKYLGVKINEGRNSFKEHKKDKIMKAKQYSNLIMSVIAKSTNKILIGKTYWKN